MDIDKHLRHSRKIDSADLDWRLAERVGLTPDEREILRYFADIEGQTVFYLRELLSTRVAQDASTLAFLTVWNYEEFFHSYYLAKLLEVCGEAQNDNRCAEVRRSARVVAKLEELVQTALARMAPRCFLGLYTTWGASQEALTLHGYEQLGRRTANPVLRTLCERIAKQERRHFAWYYGSAREALSKSRQAQAVTRFVLERFWSPVGVGVKSATEAARVVELLFPGTELDAVTARIDGRLASLPGLDGCSPVGRYRRTHLGGVLAPSKARASLADSGDLGVGEEGPKLSPRYRQV